MHSADAEVWEAERKRQEWARKVRYERARLAVTDPAGEAQAVSPMTQEEAWRDLERFGVKHGGSDDELTRALGINPFSRAGQLKCPAHEDDRPSLSYRLTGQRLLLHCFAGCSWDEIRRAVLG